MNSAKAEDVELQTRGVNFSSACRELGAVMLLSGGQMGDEYHFVLEMTAVASSL